MSREVLWADDTLSRAPNCVCWPSVWGCLCEHAGSEGGLVTWGLVRCGSGGACCHKRLFLSETLHVVYVASSQRNTDRVALFVPLLYFDVRRWSRLSPPRGAVLCCVCTGYPCFPVVDEVLRPRTWVKVEITSVKCDSSKSLASNVLSTSKVSKVKVFWCHVIPMSCYVLYTLHK